MLRKEIIKICASLAGGLVLALLIPFRSLGGWNYLALPVYFLGFVYGFTAFIPWIGKAMASVSKMLMLSVVMKSLLGFILLIIFLPIVLMVLLTLGWIIGMVKLTQCLVMVIQEERGLGSQRRQLHKNWKDHRSKRRYDGQQDSDYEFYPAPDANDNDQQLLEDSWSDNDEYSYDDYDNDEY